MNWTQQQAIELCVKLEAITPSFGAHVALTGGLLYKEGARKDCDVILYRIRQFDEILFSELFSALEAIGVAKKSGFGFCIKCEYEGRRIDFLCPEEEGEYEHDESDDSKKPIDPLSDPFVGTF